MTTSQNIGHDGSPAEPRICTGCFAAFDWTPTEHNGELFCCSVCAGEGACSCSYAGPPPEILAQREAASSAAESADSPSLEDRLAASAVPDESLEPEPESEPEEPEAAERTGEQPAESPLEPELSDLDDRVPFEAATSTRAQDDSQSEPIDPATPPDEYVPELTQTAYPEHAEPSEDPGTPDPADVAPVAATETFDIPVSSSESAPPPTEQSGGPPQEPPRTPPVAEHDHEGDEEHECYNCFQKFTWDPWTADGEEYCCWGCSDGGPCVCSYDGPPPPPPGWTPAVDASVPGEVVLTSDDDVSEIPADLPQPVPDTGPSRHDVLLAAIAEFPVDLRAVATLRVTRDVPITDIAVELDMDIETTQARLAQGRTLLNRTLGPDFRLEYTPRPTERITTPRRPPSALIAPSSMRQPVEEGDWAGQLGDSISVLQQAASEDIPIETRSATLEEALGEAAEIFRLAAQRLQTPGAEGQDLRSMLSERGGPETRVAVAGVADPTGYLTALQALEPVTNAGIESIEDDLVVYLLEIESQRELITALIGMAPPLRPQGLRVSANRIDIGLGTSLAPTQAVAAVPVAVAPGQPAAPVVPLQPAIVEAPPVMRGPGHAMFELGADAFFGARHFLTFNNRRGETHYHSWRVEVILESDANDEEGTVIGFAEVRGALEAKVSEYNETLLNNIEPFDRIQPTAENIARVIFQDIGPSLTRGSTRLTTVRVWESPTNHAAYTVN